jgi:hypothetical protein
MYVAEIYQSLLILLRLIRRGALSFVYDLELKEKDKL